MRLSFIIILFLWNHESLILWTASGSGEARTVGIQNDEDPGLEMLSNNLQQSTWYAKNTTTSNTTNEAIVNKSQVSTRSPPPNMKIQYSFAEEERVEWIKQGDNNEVYYSNDWEVWDMWENLDCDEIFESERPIHSHSTWNHARTLYRDIVGEESSIGDTDEEPNGLSVPVEAKQSPPKGRGIFALRDITAGELIWSTKKTARFQDGPSYRKFIFGLEAGFACDVLQWAYVQDVGDGEFRISVDLDEGCFCNDGGGDDEANTGCDKDASRDVEGGCRENYFAMSGIQAGEELLCSYSQFVVGDGWKGFGL